VRPRVAILREQGVNSHIETASGEGWARGAGIAVDAHVPQCPQVGWLNGRRLNR